MLWAWRCRDGVVSASGSCFRMMSVGHVYGVTVGSCTRAVRQAATARVLKAYLVPLLRRLSASSDVQSTPRSGAEPGEWTSSSGAGVGAQAPARAADDTFGGYEHDDGPSWESGLDGGDGAAGSDSGLDDDDDDDDDVDDDDDDDIEYEEDRPGSVSGSEDTSTRGVVALVLWHIERFRLFALSMAFVWFFPRRRRHHVTAP